MATLHLASPTRRRLLVTHHAAGGLHRDLRPRRTLPLRADLEPRRQGRHSCITCPFKQKTCKFPVEICTERLRHDVDNHSLHSPKKGMAEDNGLDAAGCVNSAARTKNPQFSMKNCTEQSWLDVENCSPHSLHECTAKDNGSEAAGCENLSARSKTLQSSVKNCTEHPLHDGKIAASTRRRKVWQRQWI